MQGRSGSIQTSRLLPPESAAVEVVAHAIGARVSTLERWREDAQSRPDQASAWSAARHHAVITSPKTDEAGKGAWRRAYGVYSPTLEKWRICATGSLAEETRIGTQVTRPGRCRHGSRVFSRLNPNPQSSRRIRATPDQRFTA